MSLLKKVLCSSVLRGCTLSRPALPVAGSTVSGPPEIRTPSGLFMKTLLTKNTSADTGTNASLRATSLMLLPSKPGPRFRTIGLKPKITATAISPMLLKTLLANRLGTLRTGDPAQRVRLLAEADVPHGEVVHLLDVIRTAGFAGAAIGTHREDGGRAQ